MQRIYRSKFPVGYAGMLSGIGLPRVRSLKNVRDARAEVWEVPISGSPAASTTFTLVVDGRSVSYVSDASPTQAEVEAGVLGALRQSEIYDAVKVTLNVALHKIVLERRLLGIAMVVTATNLTPTKTVAAATSTQIPFGSVISLVAESTGDQLASAHMALASEVGVGIVMATHASEKVGVGQNAVGGIQPLDVMDVVTRTLAMEGIWTRYTGTLGVTALLDSPVYQSVAAGAEGGVCHSSTAGSTAFPNAVFASNVEIDPNGNRIALVALG